MSQRTLFIDRDGTLIAEPADQQIDSLPKLKLMPGVIPALLALRDAGFVFVLVSNQDGLGTDRFPEATFREPQDFLRELLASQGISFAAEFFCPHFPADDCDCRKPKTGLLDDYLRTQVIDAAYSYVIGDRETDMELARNLGVRGALVQPGTGWPEIAARILKDSAPVRRAPPAGAPRPRTARVVRTTKETDIRVEVDLDRESPIHVATGLGFFDHMIEQIARHGGFALTLTCQGDLRIDEHHTVEDCALALGQALRESLGDKRGIGRFGFLLPMDETLAQVALDLSGRAYFVFEGRFQREQVGQLPTELVPHFFRSLADALGASLHITVRGENTHHMVEACFKGFGRTLRQAIRIDGTELPSSKGVL